MRANTELGLLLGSIGLLAVMLLAGLGIVLADALGAFG
jgi:hypothetical protein